MPLKTEKPTNLILSLMLLKGNSSGVVAYVLDCDIVVSEFELHSRYYDLFWNNTLREGLKSLISLMR